MTILPIRMQYQPTLWGILRMAVWTLFFLYGFATFLPEPKPTLTTPEHSENPYLIPMNLEHGDIKWVRKNPGPLPGRKIKIAWVGDSSAEEVKINSSGAMELYFLPDKVIWSFEKLFDIIPNVLLYYSSGRREAQTYALLLEAISQKPDAIVLTLNPFWVFNPYSISMVDNYYGTAMNSRGWQLDRWIFSSLLAYPRATAFSLVGHYFRLFRDNLGYHRLFVQGKPSPSFHTPFGKRGVLTADHFNNPTAFWFDMREFKEYAGGRAVYGGKGAEIWQRKVLRVSNPDKANWNQFFLRQSLERLAEAGIPAFIYLAPVNPELMADKVDSERYLAIKNALKQYADTAPANIKFDLSIPSEITSSIKFTDLYHYSESGRLPDFLASGIQAMMGRHD